MPRRIEPKAKRPCVSCGELTRDYYTRSPVNGHASLWCATCYEESVRRWQMGRNERLEMLFKMRDDGFSAGV